MELQLGDLLNFRRGYDLPQAKMISGQYPVVASNGIIGFHNEFTTEAPCLTIGRSGNVGKPILINQKSWAHNTTLYVDDFKENSPLFLYYLLCTLRLEHYKGGSAVPTLNRNHIHPIKVSTTKNVKEQKAIAAVLSALDDKIELNNRINKNLEAQAQAIFKSWFVDFQPFQDGEFVESELGLIPKGWSVCALGDISSYVTEKMPIELLDANNYISTENMLANKQGVTAASSLPSAPAVGKYRVNDILVSNIRPYFKKLWFANQSGGCSNDVLVFRAKNRTLNSFLYCLLYSDAFFDYVTMTSKGTKMPRGDKNAIMNYKIALPSVLIEDVYIEKLSGIVESFQLKISELQKENRTLAALRDTLLPKLMSGEIRVPLEV